MDEMNKIVICKKCRNPEYWGEMRWLSGTSICRNCYIAKWQSENGQLYKWDDLDGQRPTMSDYRQQECEE